MGQSEFTTDIRRRKELTEKERYTLELCLKRKDSLSSIAVLLGVSVKTVRREIIRGTVIQRDTYLREYECYKADYAQRIHDMSVRRRGRKPSCIKHMELIRHIRVKLREKWSPDAIIGSLRLEGETTVCTKTVYNWLHSGYIEGFELRRRNRVVRRRMTGWKNPNAKRIDERPGEAELRQSGHWEMDTVVSGKDGKGCLLVLTERASRTELIYPLSDRKQSSVSAVLNRLERRYKSKFNDIFKTITCDNGSEFLDSVALENSCLHGGKRTDIYYAHPYSSWERGSNENNNKLIRKFVKKGEDISKLPVSYIKRVERWMNTYPRKIFGYKTADMTRIA